MAAEAAGRMNAALADDEIPPCVGEGFRDALADILRTSREIADAPQRQKPLKAKRSGQSHNLGLYKGKKRE